MTTNFPLLLLLPLTLILVVLWGIIKNVIRSNGYPSDPFREHTRDIANLHDLATWEKNPAKRPVSLFCWQAFTSLFLPWSSAFSSTW